MKLGCRLFGHEFETVTDRCGVMIAGVPVDVYELLQCSKCRHYREVLTINVAVEDHGGHHMLIAVSRERRIARLEDAAVWGSDG